MSNFTSLATRSHISYLAAHGLSSVCIAHLLDLAHTTVRYHYRALGLKATTRKGGLVIGLGTAGLIRVLTALGLATPVVCALAGCRPHYVRRVCAA